MTTTAEMAEQHPTVDVPGPATKDCPDWCEVDHDTMAWDSDADENGVPVLAIEHRCQVNEDWSIEQTARLYGDGAVRLLPPLLVDGASEHHEVAEARALDRRLHDALHLLEVAAGGPPPRHLRSLSETVALRVTPGPDRAEKEVLLTLVADPTPPTTVLTNPGLLLVMSKGASWAHMPLQQAQELRDGLERLLRGVEARGDDGVTGADRDRPGHEVGHADIVSP